MDENASIICLDPRHYGVILISGQFYQLRSYVEVFVSRSGVSIKLGFWGAVAFRPSVFKTEWRGLLQEFFRKGL